MQKAKRLNGGNKTGWEYHKAGGRGHYLMRAAGIPLAALYKDEHHWLASLLETDQHHAQEFVYPCHFTVDEAKHTAEEDLKALGWRWGYDCS